MKFLSIFSVAWILFFVHVVDLATSQKLRENDCIKPKYAKKVSYIYRNFQKYSNCERDKLTTEYETKIMELKNEHKEQIDKLRSEHDTEIMELRAKHKKQIKIKENETLECQKIIEDYNPDYTPETENCPPSYEIVVKDPKKLAKHIQCDKNNSESDPECIQRLQGLLEKFVNIDPKLEQEEHETLYRYKLRMGHLMTGAKQAYKHYSNLYDRCESGVSSGFG